MLVINQINQASGVGELFAVYRNKTRAGRLLSPDGDFCKTFFAGIRTLIRRVKTPAVRIRPCRWSAEPLKHGSALEEQL